MQEKTIQNLLQNDFKNLTMKKEIEETIADNATQKWLSKVKNIFKKETVDSDELENTNEKASIDNSLDEVFKSIISAEIKKTNREEIKAMASSQAKEVSGDSQVISMLMDSLYHLFVSDKKENDENKEKLYKKIEYKVEEFTQNINSQKDERLNSVMVENNTEEKRIEYQKTESTAKKNQKEGEKKNILETKIATIEKQIENIKDKITTLDIDFVRPMFKHHEFWPQLFFLIGISIAMVLFYSSSAYIMLYSYEDAMEAVKTGINVNAQVYESKAFTKAIAKGGSTMLYILVFVFIPFTIAYIAHDVDEKSDRKIFNAVKKYGSYFFVIMIDTFIAFKVSETIGEINYLSKGIVYERTFYDVNFWLVFFLGAIPFFFLAELMNKLINFFANRSVQTGREKMLVEKKVALTKIDDANKEIIKLRNNTNNIDLEINKLESEITQLEHTLIALPKELDLKISQINQEANNNIANVRKKADVYKNDIENDNIQISLSSLKDRVSAFIEGWNEWLHSEYSIDKAVGMSQEAIKVSEQWLTDNMKKIEL